MPPKRKTPEGKSEPGKKGKQTDPLRDMAMRLRIHAIEMCSAAKSGHPTSCSSIAEVMAVLFFDPDAGMRFDPLHPENMLNDRLVLSKGHAAPILCSFACAHPGW